MTATTLPRRRDLRPLPPFTQTTQPVDLAELSIWELRVVVYASGYQATGDDHLSPIMGLRRLITCASAAAQRLGLDTIRDIAAILEYAELHHDQDLIARFCPDTVRWSFTSSAVRMYRTHISRIRLALHLVDVLADQLTTDPAAVAS
jgi:hypothetical protein